MKRHPLFQEIDFETIHLTKTPIHKIAPTFAIEESDTEDQIDQSNEPRTRPKAHSEYDPRLNRQPKTICALKEPIILSDCVRKNLGWFIPMYKQRQLILTPTRLIYYDPTTDMALVS